jgi:hypothetical protein
MNVAKVIVSGAIANKCQNGGATWTRLSWVLGFRRLGCDVCFLEELPEEVDESSPAVRYLQDVTRQFGLHGRGTAGLIGNHGRSFWGMTEREICQSARDADLLVNISGHLTWQPAFDACRRKAYVDLDPGYTQCWHASGTAGARLEGHDYYFTVGENIGTPECPIPTCGVRWLPIRQPVLLSEWPALEPPTLGRFTTIASWRGVYGPVEHEGRNYGLKVHEFRKFLALPQLAAHEFEIALDIHPDEQTDLERLRQNGWKVADPRKKAGGPGAFRSYVQSSGAEFSVAQGIYVETNSGWFSDRTTRYLASGKPALVQDTGFSRNLPVGEGLLAFRTLDEAVAGAEAIRTDYVRHSAAARRIAEDYFDSDKVLGTMLEEVGIVPN